MSKMKRAIEKFQIDIKMKRLDLHFKRELENVRKKSPVEVKSLDSSQLKQINDFYNGFGFHGVDTRWHEYLYAVTGRHSVNYIPENFYHCTIEPLYTRGSVDLEDTPIVYLSIRTCSRCIAFCRAKYPRSVCGFLGGL